MRRFYWKICYSGQFFELACVLCLLAKKVLTALSRRYVNPLIHNTEKWPNTLKIVLCKRRKILKVYLAISQHYEWGGYIFLFSGSTQALTLDRYLGKMLIQINWWVNCQLVVSRNTVETCVKLWSVVMST